MNVAIRTVHRGSAAATTLRGDVGRKTDEESRSEGTADVQLSRFKFLQIESYKSHLKFGAHGSHSPWPKDGNRLARVAER